MKLDLTFQLERYHKHSVRYVEVDEAGNPKAEPYIGKIYVNRRTYTTPPRAIKVTLEFVDHETAREE